MVKRAILAGAVLLLGSVFVLVSAGPASAVIDAGPCSGSGKFVNDGKTVQASEPGVVEVPIKDTVNWEGSLNASTGDVPYNGKIEVEMPAPFPALKIDDWSGTTDSTGNSGTKDYDVPSWVPRNVELDVVGEHTQGPVKCKGHVKIKLAGSVFGPATLISLVATLLGALASAFAVLRGRPILGAFAGFFLFLFLALSLLFLGVIPLASALITIMPILGIVLGGVAAKFLPFGGSGTPAPPPAL